MKPVPSALAAAICDVMRAVPHVTETGRASPKVGGYAFATDADLVRAFQPAMAAAGLALVPVAIDVTERTSDHPKGNIATVLVTYQLLHTSGEAMTVCSVGTGWDSLDKAVYKAMTGALKYALRQTFLPPITTGDDVERPSPADEPAPAQRTTSSANPRRDLHHPSWERDRERFCARLVELGTTYDDVARFCTVVLKLSRPSAWSTDARDRLLSDLPGDLGVQLHEWLAKEAP